MSAAPALRCVVTGASGFVGATLCRRLAVEGWTVHALAHRHPERVPDVCASLTVIDLEQPIAWPSQLAGVDCVIHSAGHAHTAWDGSARARERIIAVNAQAGARLAQAAFAGGVRRFMLLSSATVYGESMAPQPFTPDSPVAPKGPYAESKLMAERLMLAAAAEHGGEWTIVRPPLVHGPGVRANFLRLMRWVERGIPLPLAAVVNRRSLIHVDNLADALTAAAASPHAAGRILLPTDGDWSTPSLIRALAAALGCPARLFAVPDWLLRWAESVGGLGEPLRRLTRSLALSDPVLEDAIGWRAPLAAGDAIAATASWFRNRPERRRI